MPKVRSTWLLAGSFCAKSFLAAMLLVVSDAAFADAAAVYKAVADSVVTVTSTSAGETLLGSGVVVSVGRAKGSGAPISWIATNAHVLGKSNVPEVRTSAGRLFGAVVEWRDTAIDLALLRVEGVSLPAATLHAWADIHTGDTVFAIGSPLGLSGSITEGIISSKRTLAGVKLVQTSAPISHGNSGGGLFAEDGKLIGITAFSLKGAGNVNFAISSGHLLEVQDGEIAADSIRAMAAYVSLGDPALLADQDFVSYLAFDRDSSGRPLGEAVLAEVARATEDQSRFQEEVSFVRGVVSGFPNWRLSRTAGNPPDDKSTGLPGARFTLVCELQSGTYTYHVDPQQRTINGARLAMTDDAYAWLLPSSTGDAFEMTLNRYTGMLTGSHPGSPPVPVGSCRVMGKPAM